MARFSSDIDRTPRVCLHRTQHEHGHRLTYRYDRCRCLPCAEANAVMTKQYPRPRRPRGVDASFAIEHLRYLATANMGMERIARSAGVNICVVRRLLAATGPTRVHGDISCALLAVRLDIGGRRLMESIGSTRRVQALCVAGFPTDLQARYIGIDRTAVARIAAGRHHLRMSTVTAVTHTFEELRDRRPPTSTVKERAATSRIQLWAHRHDCLPGEVWTDVTIDDPSEIDAHAVLQFLAGDQSLQLPPGPERLLIVTALHGRGLNDPEIASRTGLTRRQVEYVRLGLQLPAVVERVA